MSDQAMQNDIKTIKEELVVLRQHMSNLWFADSLQNMSTKSEKVEEVDGAAAKSYLGASDDKKKGENEIKSVWDVDDKMSGTNRRQSNGEETSDKVVQLETMMKSMMVQMKQDKSQLRDLTADIKLLEANLKISDSNAKLLEYKLKASDEKINQLEVELRQERDKFDNYAVEQGDQRQKMEEDLRELQKILEIEWRQKMDKLNCFAATTEQDVKVLKEKLTNLERARPDHETKR